MLVGLFWVANEIKRVQGVAADTLSVCPMAMLALTFADPATLT